MLTVVSNGTTSITLQLTNSLDHTIFNYPVTLRRLLPPGWQAAAITQNGAAVSSRVVDGRLMFDVPPNGGDIVLEAGDGSFTFEVTRLVSTDAFIPNNFAPYAKQDEPDCPLETYLRPRGLGDSGSVRFCESDAGSRRSCLPANASTA